MTPRYRRALIVGAGPGLSSALARLFAANGLQVALAARRPDKLKDLQAATGAAAYACDVGDAAAVARLFAELDENGAPDVVVYNPSARVRGPLADLDPEGVRDALLTTAYGGFLVAQQAVRRMVAQQHGALLFTGASASVKGFAHSASFAMGKFALRGLAQSLARELHPQGIHIGHVVIDGGIRSEARPERHEAEPDGDTMLDPDAIARSYWHFLAQDRSAWAWEIELRPWVERF